MPPLGAQRNGPSPSELVNPRVLEGAQRGEHDEAHRQTCTGPRPCGRRLATSAAAKGELMTIYRLLPSAPADDPGWDLALNHGEVVVHAHSTGEARAIAALEEASIRAHGLPPTTTQVVASAFRNEKLYTVVEDDSGAFDDSGPVRVVRGEFAFPMDYDGLKVD